MEKNPIPPVDAAELRRRAEERLKKKKVGQVRKRSTPLSAEETQRLAQELQLHQIELEMRDEELRQSRAEVEAGLALYTDLYDFAPVSYFTLDRDGTIHRVNLIGARLLGKECSQLVNRRFGHFVSVADRPVFNTFLKKVFASRTKETCEAALCTGDKRPPSPGNSDNRRFGETTQLIVHIEAVASENGQECRAVITDITDHKQTDEVLHISETRYRRLFESAQDGILIIDADTEQIIDANPFMHDLLGYSCEEFVGKRLWDIGAFKDVAASKISFDELKRNGYIRYEDLPLDTNDGRSINVEFVSNLYMVDSKRVIQCNIRDITSRKQVEKTLNEEIHSMSQQLWQTAKLATLGELAASIAHELNNPLATVSLRIESLLEKTHEDNSNHRELEIIEQEIDRMSNLIANLLQFSRRGQQQISTVHICEEIEKTLELVYHHLRNHNIIIEREFAKDVPNIYADRQQLRQLFLNVFTNAGDAMPQGGTLTIRVIAPPEARQLIVEIADTGTGIPPEILLKVGEPFYTTKEEGNGTGLGVAICRRIVQEHNGAFDITSEGIPGMGTMVRISLPV